MMIKLLVRTLAFLVGYCAARHLVGCTDSPLAFDTAPPLTFDDPYDTGVYSDGGDKDQVRDVIFVVDGKSVLTVKFDYRAGQIVGLTGSALEKWCAR